MRPTTPQDFAARIQHELRGIQMPDRMVSRALQPRLRNALNALSVAISHDDHEGIAAARSDIEAICRLARQEHAAQAAKKDRPS